MAIAFAQLDPIANPSFYDAVQIGGKISPGLAVVEATPRKTEWDIKKGKGVRGATSTLVQQPPAEVTIKFYLWDNGTLGTGHNHFAEWDAFYPLLQFDPTKQEGKAIELWHPALAGIDLSAVVVDHITSLAHLGRGLYMIEVKLHEYLPAVATSAVSTPTQVQAAGGDGQGGPGAPADPVADADQQEISNLYQQAQQP